MNKIIPIPYYDNRKCRFGCCTTQIEGVRTIIKELDGTSICVTKELAKDSHGIQCVIRGYNLYFREPVLIWRDSKAPWDRARDFEEGMSWKHLEACLETYKITSTCNEHKQFNGEVPAEFVWSLNVE